MSASLLKDRYELQSKLGSGGFSTVFAAQDTLLDREVAIKILKASLHDDEELVQRFLLEAKLTSKLTHPNSLTVHDFGRDDQGHCFFVTELLRGQSLHERLYTKALSISEALSVAAQVALALSEAHDKEVVHRDIKPGNVFLCDQANGAEPFVKLLDFGIAKSVGFDGQTVTGQMMGTPTYMSPEQIVNIKEVDHRSDLYSLGIVLFHMLSGQPPFKGDSYFDTMRMHMQAPLPTLAIVNCSEELKLELSHLLQKLTAKDKRKRYESALELHQALMIAKHRASLEEARGLISVVSINSTQGAEMEETQVTPTSLSFSPEQNPVQPSASHPQAMRNSLSARPRQSPQEHRSGSQVSQAEIEDQVEWGESPLSVTKQKSSTPFPLSDPFEDDLFDFLREPNAMDQTNEPLVDPFALPELSSTSSHSTTTPYSSHSSTMGESAKPPSIKLKRPMEEGKLAEYNRVSRSEDLSHLDNRVSRSESKAQDDQLRIESRPSADFTFAASRDAELSKLAPSPMKIFRILILDPNEFAGELYKKGLVSGAERRAREREAQGFLSSDMLSVSISTTENALIEDIEWGADLLLIDLKSRDGVRESEGIAMLKELRTHCPPHCKLIALCKDPVFASDAIDAGADAVLNKPVRNQQLFKAVSVYLWKS